jgi:acetyl esterase
LRDGDVRATMVVALSLTLKRRLRLRQGQIVARALDRGTHALAAIGYSLPPLRPERRGVRLERDIVYGRSSRFAHRLDVWTPTRVRERPLPVVMYVHGGGFGMLSKETHRVMAYSIARGGYLVFNVNYRLGQRHQYPEPLEDVSDALLWVARNAERWGGDPTRLAVAGESAGGNLVTALALAHAVRFDEPFARRVHDANLSLRAVVSTYPFLDVSDVPRYMKHERMPAFVKALLFDAATSYVGGRVFGDHHHTLASPLLLLEQGLSLARPLPPFFISVGTRDPLLPHSIRLRDALLRHGAPCELVIAPGEIHGYDAMLWREAAREKWRRAHAFLERWVRSPRE